MQKAISSLYTPRIALAGPAAGLLSVLLFYCLWMAYSNDIFLASVMLACIINLFNLLFPIAILDGGRVIKSILHSINRRLGDSFYVFGFVVIGTAYIFGLFSLFFVALLGYFLYREWAYIQYERAQLKQLEIIKSDTFVELLGPSKSKLKSESENEYLKLDAIVNIKKMTWKEMVVGSLSYVGIIITYLLTWGWVRGYVGWYKFAEYFR